MNINKFPKTWRACKWPFDSDYAKKTSCFVRDIKRGKIYLRDEVSFPFTVSCGGNSERSFSGCFYGHAHVASLHAAMVELDQQEVKGVFAQ